MRPESEKNELVQSIALTELFYELQPAGEVADALREILVEDLEALRLPKSSSLSPDD